MYAASVLYQEAASAAFAGRLSHFRLMTASNTGVVQVFVIIVIALFSVCYVLHVHIIAQIDLGQHIHRNCIFVIILVKYKCILVV